MRSGGNQTKPGDQRKSIIGSYLPFGNGRGTMPGDPEPRESRWRERARAAGTPQRRVAHERRGQRGERRGPEHEPHHAGATDDQRRALAWPPPAAARPGEQGCGRGERDQAEREALRGRRGRVVADGDGDDDREAEQGVEPAERERQPGEAAALSPAGEPLGGA